MCLLQRLGASTCSVPVTYFLHHETGPGVEPCIGPVPVRTWVYGSDFKEFNSLSQGSYSVGWTIVRVTVDRGPRRGKSDLLKIIGCPHPYLPVPVESFYVSPWSPVKWVIPWVYDTSLVGGTPDSHLLPSPFVVST